MMVLWQGDSPLIMRLRRMRDFVIANKNHSHNIDILSAFPLVPALEEQIAPSPPNVKCALGFWVSLFFILNF